MKYKQSETGIADYGYFAKNLVVIRCYGLFRNTADFARALKLKDTKRLVEVEKGRMKPNKKEVNAIIKATGFSLHQLCNSKLSLKIICKHDQ